MGLTVPASNTIWNVPFERNRFFTGREEALRDLEAGLSKGAVALGQAIAGLGGIGKTQTAVEFAYLHADKYEAVLWVPSETESELVSGFAALASEKILNLPEKDAAQQQLAVQAVQRWLTEHDKWLLILDNADDLKLASRFVPQGARGHLLYTTRSSVTGRFANRIPLEELSPEQGAEFLLKRIGEITPATSPQWEDAKALSEAMDGLPLALEQAGAFIEENHRTIREYTRLYQQEALQLMARHGDLGDESHKPVTVTFTLAYEQLEQQNPMAARLLRLCAFFAPDNIPEEILEDEYGDLTAALGGALATEWERINLIRAVCSRSLLTRDAADRSLSLHRLVQLVLRESLNADAKREWAEHAVNVLDATFGMAEFEEWPRCERFLPHALLAIGRAAQQGIETENVARLNNQVGYYLKQRAQYATAEPLYERALEIGEKVLGAEHPDTATTLNNVAKLYRAQGKLSEALPLYKRSLAIREKVLGQEHPDTATSLNNLAELYRDQGRFSKAELLYKRSLAIREKVLGQEHRDTAISLNNLAQLYQDQGKLSEAEPLFQHSLTIFEQVLGPEHPETAFALNNLALLYKTQAKLSEAGPLYERALAILQKALGPEHPDTATALNNLAGLYYAQGKFSEAKPLLERALAIREKSLGPEHPDTVTCRQNLAILREEMAARGEK